MGVHRIRSEKVKRETLFKARRSKEVLTQYFLNRSGRSQKNMHGRERWRGGSGI